MHMYTHVNVYCEASSDYAIIVVIRGLISVYSLIIY